MIILLMLLSFFQDARPTPRPPAINPNTDPDAGPKQKLEGDVVIPKGGVLSIPFFPPFSRPASCSLADKTDPKGPGVAVKMDAPEWIIIEGKKGHVVHYECVGLPTNSGSKPKNKETASHRLVGVLSPREPDTIREEVP